MDPLTLAAGATAFEIIGQVASQLNSARTTAANVVGSASKGSLIRVTQTARVEPLAIVDADVMNVDYLPDVMQTLQSLFAGYYLQAVNLMGVVGDVSIGKVLAPLNPNRAVGFESIKPDFRMTTPAYRHCLPTKKRGLALEADHSAVAAVTDQKALSGVHDASNLAVGKLFNVTLRDGPNSATVPVAIRLMISTVPTTTLIALFTFKDSFDMDMKERWHAYKAGRLSFFKDLVFCRDLVRKHRKAAMQDKSNLYNQILGRENNNRIAGIVNQSPSLATSSNLAVISADTLAQIEQKISGRFTSFKVRQQLFDNTNLMIMAVIEKDWDRITFYSDGIEGGTTVSARDLKSSSKGGGSDVTDIMKAFISGSNIAM